MDVTKLVGLKRTAKVDDQQGWDGPEEPGSREPIGVMDYMDEFKVD